MYRPDFHTYRNHNFGQWSPNLRPRAPYLPRNKMGNQHRYPGPLILQNSEFWCETCDRGFQSLKILESHKQQHQKCNIDGCQFVAHPKIITKHIQMQHSTGLYKKIAKLNNPEEIQKWREERKRKYPTKQNIEMKAAIVREKLERGEKMGMKFDMNNKRHKTEDHPRNKHILRKEKKHLRVNSNAFRKENKKPIFPKTVCKTMPSINEVCQLKPFSGIQHILTEGNYDEGDYESQQDGLIEDDIFTEEVRNNAVNSVSQSEPLVCGALSSLICNYGSSDDELSNSNNILEKSNDNHNDILSKNNETDIPKEIVEEKQYLIRNVKSDDDSGPEEILIKKEPENVIIESETKVIEKKIRNERPNTKFVKKPKRNLPSTLLLKLLSREIEHERNVILQCVRYVVKNKYFDQCNKNN